MGLTDIAKYIPEVREPIRRLNFNERLKWTAIVLGLYFLMSNISLYGLSSAAVDQFQSFRAILAGNFGSIVTLGIGPIVTASIILQLLSGSDILQIDTSTPEGKKKYEALERTLVIFVTLFESGLYVLMGGLPPANPTLLNKSILIGQLVLGTFLLILMDQISSRWGFMSGISLFIAAGVSEQIVTGIFNPFANPQNPGVPAGRLFAAITYLVQGDPISAATIFLPVIFTVIIFFITVYASGIKIEIPLAFARVRGAVTRWPLNLFYTSNIPVIFTAALIANFELWSRFLANRGLTFFGTFDASGRAIGGLALYFIPPTELIFHMIFSPITFFKGLFTGGVYLQLVLRAIVYTIAMVAGSVMFARFWVYTSNMDSRAVAKQIQQGGFGIPGFRRDPRILTKVLDRYIPYLTDLGGIAVGLLAAVADFTNSLSRGTGILLSVMIIYQLYQTIMQQYAMDMNPMVRKFLKGE
ncbi:MAG: preprotein translocase subunit SecY [Candidatus Altiarchaeota archaeon]|nr:preprotein translocase subunit SecY [Candidatus Altiarchaeota archaeon]